MDRRVIRRSAQPGRWRAPPGGASGRGSRRRARARCARAWRWRRAESPGAARCKRTPGRVVARDPPPAGRPGGGARRGFVAVAVDPPRSLLAGRSGRRARDGAPRRLRARSPPGGRRLRTRAGRDALARLRRSADQLRHVGRRRRARASRAGPATRRPDGSIHLPRDARPRAARVTGGALSRGAPRRGVRRGHRALPPGLRRHRCGCHRGGRRCPGRCGHRTPAGGGEAGCVARGRRHGRPACDEPLRTARGAERPPAGARDRESDQTRAARSRPRHRGGDLRDERRCCGPGRGARASRRQHRRCLRARPPHARTGPCSRGGSRGMRAMPARLPGAWRRRLRRASSSRTACRPRG